MPGRCVSKDEAPASRWASGGVARASRPVGPPPPLGGPPAAQRRVAAQAAADAAEQDLAAELTAERVEREDAARGSHICARCPAPATHACDCGATGCDEHRGCEHAPERLRAVGSWPRGASGEGDAEALRRAAEQRPTMALAPGAELRETS